MLRVPWRLAGTVVLLAVLAAPVYLFVRLHDAPTPGRAEPPHVALDARVLPTVPPYRAAVPVLAYHDISSRLGPQTIPPRAFAEQMDALHLAGFHTISAAQMLAFLEGHETLPERPLLITFENGLASAWRVADPILEQYGFRAISFVDVEHVAQRGYYYLGEGELRAMAQSGRWDLEPEASFAEKQGAIDASGQLGSALTNRLWLPRARRLESAAEFNARMSSALEHSMTVLRGLGGDPLMLGYPFAPTHAPSDDPGAAHAVETLARRRFPLSLVDGGTARFIDGYDRGASLLPATVVERTTSVMGLLDSLAALAPVSPRVGNAIAGGQPWFAEGTGTSAPTIHGGVLTLAGPSRGWAATYWAPGRCELWRDYRASVTVEGLGSESSGASATLLVGGATGAAYAVTVSAGRISVTPPSSRAGHGLATAKIPESSQHRLTVDLHGAGLHVVVDGRRVGYVPLPSSTHGGIGLGSWRANSSSPVPAFTRLSVEPLS